MLDNTRRLATRAIPLMIGVGAIGAALGAATPAASIDREAGASRGAHAPVRCVINSGSSGGMLTLQGLVSADLDATGTYRFTVRGGGSGGAFGSGTFGGWQASDAGSIDSDDVLDARMAPGFARCPTSAKSALLVGSRSTIASITRSAPSASLASAAGEIRASRASPFSSVERPREIAFSTMSFE